MSNNISYFSCNITEFINIFKENTILIYKAILNEKNIIFIGYDTKV